MKHAFKIIATIYIVSLALAAAAAPFKKPIVSGALAAPALAVAVLAFGGHLITLDDDYPGGWSNPEKNRAVWRSSLRMLGVKFSALIIAAVVLIIGITPG